jgi:hypothetical protein
MQVQVVLRPFRYSTLEGRDSTQASSNGVGCCTGQAPVARLGHAPERATHRAM